MTCPDDRSPPSESQFSALHDLIRGATPYEIYRLLREVAARPGGRAAMMIAVHDLPARQPRSISGAEARILLRAAGTLLSLPDVAVVLGINRHMVRELLAEDCILALRVGSQLRFPETQFAQNEILSGISTVLRALSGFNRWDVLRILLSPLDNPSESPIQMLRRGEKATALLTVSRAAVQLAQDRGELDVLHVPWSPVKAAIDADLEADLRREREFNELIRRARE